MIRRPPRSTRTDTLFPYTTLFRSSGQDAFTIFAQDMGRTGYVAGTLAVREGLRAPVPQVDPRPILTMDDMGHGMMMGGGMDHSMAGMSGRSEERRVGKECVSTCRSRWSPYP